MAQESASDIMQMAKDYAKVEKDLKVQKYVYVSFERTDVNGSNVRIFSYDLPREVYERHLWVIRWREARLICQHPKGNITRYVSFYDKRLGNDPKLTADLHTFIAAKAQVTNAKRKIEQYVSYHKTNDMFFDEQTDSDLLKAREKLAAKVANVEAAEERLKLKIEQIKSIQQ